MTISFNGGPVVTTWGTDEHGKQLWRARLADNWGFFAAPKDARLSVLYKLALKAIADAVES